MIKHKGRDTGGVNNLTKTNGSVSWTAKVCQTKSPSLIGNPEKETQLKTQAEENNFQKGR